MLLRVWQTKFFLFGLSWLAAMQAIAASPADPQDSSPAQRPILLKPTGSSNSVTWKTLAPNILHDQKSIWTFPAVLAHGQHWKPALGITLSLGGLMALDPYDTPYFHRTTAFSGFNRDFSGRNMSLAIAIVPVSFYAAGWARKDSYAQQTSLLAGEAAADAEILTWVFKAADARRRPGAIPPGENYSDSWFESYQSPLSARGSFPSGHTIAAFSVATIFARRYGRHRWVPWVAYGAAGLVGFSRITLQAHFPSDVFAGAAFGYIISRYSVLGGR